MIVRTLALAASVAAVTQPVLAGGLAPTPETPIIVVPEPVEPQRSSWGIILPILAVAILIGLASSGDDDEDDDTGTTSGTSNVSTSLDILSFDDEPFRA